MASVDACRESGRACLIARRAVWPVPRLLVGSSGGWREACSNEATGAGGTQALADPMAGCIPAVGCKRATSFQTWIARSLASL
ncbi:MAG: hypothetical protein AB9879_05095 [Methanothrix sp.]